MKSFAGYLFNWKVFFKSILLVLFCAGPSLAQNAQEPPILSSAINIDLGGKAGLAAINYERVIIGRKKLQLASGIGIGSFKVIDFRNKFNPDLLIPFGLHLLLGGPKHKAVLGGGLTAQSLVIAKNECITRYYGLAGYFKAGYRFHFSDNKFFMQLSYTPIIDRGFPLRHWGGLSFGKIF